MREQLSLNLPYRTAYGREAFWIAPCNAQAVAWIDKYPNWPVPAVFIYGPAGSGKTHLVHLFTENVIDGRTLTSDYRPPFQKKIAVENVDKLASEEALLHLFNFIKELGGHLLLTGQKAPRFSLPDLQSRMALIPKVEIAMPDEQVIQMVAKKAFEDRHILVEENVLNYLATHLTRSFPLVQRVVELADKKSLSIGRKITIPILKQVIDEINEEQEL
ncbi:MAG: hypothetical protein ACI4OR_01200 [Alphaproteobacteria bacterium]